MDPNPGAILIVDDEPALLLVMQQYLQRIGYEVHAFRSGEEAWTDFQAMPSRYGLVIVDILMPDIPGDELVSKMAELDPAIRVLICSGYPFDLSTLPTTLQTRAAFLQKPFAPQMLVSSVKALLSAGAHGSPA